jgi:hypothetical protein
MTTVRENFAESICISRGKCEITPSQSSPNVSEEEDVGDNSFMQCVHAICAKIKIFDVNDAELLPRIAKVALKLIAKLRVIYHSAMTFSNFSDKMRKWRRKIPRNSW